MYNTPKTQLLASIDFNWANKRSPPSHTTGVIFHMYAPDFPQSVNIHFTDCESDTTVGSHALIYLDELYTYIVHIAASHTRPN